MNKKKPQIFIFAVHSHCVLSLPSLVETQVGLSINSFSHLWRQLKSHMCLLTLRLCFMLVRHITLSGYLVSAVKHLSVKNREENFIFFLLFPAFLPLSHIDIFIFMHVLLFYHVFPHLVVFGLLLSVAHLLSAPHCFSISLFLFSRSFSFFNVIVKQYFSPPFFSSLLCMCPCD